MLSQSREEWTIAMQWLPEAEMTIVSCNCLASLLKHSVEEQLELQWLADEEAVQHGLKICRDCSWQIMYKTFFGPWHLYAARQSWTSWSFIDSEALINMHVQTHQCRKTVLIVTQQVGAHISISAHRSLDGSHAGTSGNA